MRNLAAILILIVGIFLGWLFFGTCNTAKFPYLNKNAICNGKEIINKSGYEPFRDELVSFIELQERTGTADEVSVYFRDLHSGPIFGINELEDYSPASLLKVPLALAYFSLEESKPGVLGQKIEYAEPAFSMLQSYKPSATLELGHVYTIEELINYMLIYSDNAAAEVLRSYLANFEGGSDLLYRTYVELGILVPEDTLDESVSVKGYATIFRILYNASYLNEELANKMLSWLSRSEFKGGLVSGVPATISVVHKFGERVIVDETGKELKGGKQLHDCGIVYYPDNPYVLCVMTKGDDWNKLKFVISEISRLTYREVNSRRF